MENNQIPKDWITEKALISECRPLDWRRERFVNETLDRYQMETDEVKWVGEDRYVSPEIAAKVKEEVQKALS